MVWTFVFLVNFQRTNFLNIFETKSIANSRIDRYALPESPRWLLAKGRIDELKKIIETAARWNKQTLPPNYEKVLIVPSGENSSGSFIDLFKAEYLRTTLLLMVAWYALVLQYMAITLHIGEMGGNIYLTTVRFANSKRTV